MGVRFLGEMEGTFKDGPHRLDAGFWISTDLPDLPVSYYVSFTEPISNNEKYGNEANIRLRSSIRTGYSHHEISLNKRFQQGFNELNYQEFSLGVSREKLIDISYRPYPLLWENTDWKTMLSGSAWISQVFDIGQFDAKASVNHDLSGNYTVGTAEVKQQIPLGELFNLRLRGFFGGASASTPNEYLFGESYRQPIAWLNNGVSRAKGTLPQSLLDDGLFQISGGANLRGYAAQNFKSLSLGQAFQYTFVAALNSEIEFPNPVNQLISYTIMADFIQVRSYVFGDVGRLANNSFQTRDLTTVNPAIPIVVTETEVDRIRADAGIGLQFSLNIPDYLGKDRGFALRYEIPFWISDPGSGKKSFKFRNLIGIGAIISL